MVLKHIKIYERHRLFPFTNKLPIKLGITSTLLEKILILLILVIINFNVSAQPPHTAYLKAVRDSINMPIAVFAAGCFWQAEAHFGQLPGVVRTQVGYMGGYVFAPSYRQVISGRTGHAEVVKIWYDPQKISYRTLLREFWGMHRPERYQKVGKVPGAQYQSTIFYCNEIQKQTALQAQDEMESNHDHSFCHLTRIRKAHLFFPASTYHQHYYKKSKIGKISPTCH